MGSLVGGKKQTVPASGFFALPQSYQNAYNTVAGNLESQIGGINAGMFTPMAQTADETRALDMFRQGFAPTQQSLQSDISMLSNPFNNYVIDDVNRQASGDYSILKQAMNQAGQFGSNRQMLGANDIEQTRLGTIGKIRQDQYNNIINQIFNNLIPQRQNDAQALLGVGDFQRELDSRQKTAPLQALTAQESLLGGIPTSFGEFGRPQQTIKTGGGLGGFLGGLSSLGGLASGAGGLASAAGYGGLGSFLSGAGSLMAFSDRRLKENITYIGEESGFPVYSFNYKGSSEIIKGVMADDVEEIMPDAVTEIDGYKAVDYGMIGVKMEVLNGAV